MRPRPGAVLALLMLAVFWGLCGLLAPATDLPTVEAVPLGDGASFSGEIDIAQIINSPDGSGTTPALPNASAGAAFRNTGRVGCRLRVRLCVPQVDGKPLLQAGVSDESGFTPAGCAPPSGPEYWTLQGEYLYYHNDATGGVLPPGCQTPALYSALRLNPALSQSDLQRLALTGPQQLFLFAELSPE